MQTLSAHLKAEAQAFSFKRCEECTRNWADAMDNAAANDTVFLLWNDEILFGRLISGDT